MTKLKPMQELKWWARWWVRYFPRNALNRIRYCRHGHAEPVYGWDCCLMCGAPWFGVSD